MIYYHGIFYECIYGAVSLTPCLLLTQIWGGPGVPKVVCWVSSRLYISDLLWRSAPGMCSSPRKHASRHRELCVPLLARQVFTKLVQSGPTAAQTCLHLHRCGSSGAVESEIEIWILAPRPGESPECQNDVFFFLGQKTPGVPKFRFQFPMLFYFLKIGPVAARVSAEREKSGIPCMLTSCIMSVSKYWNMFIVRAQSAYYFYYSVYL